MTITKSDPVPSKIRAARPVYALCASGRLEYLRISTHAIRIAGGDLRRFVRSCSGHR